VWSVPEAAGWGMTVVSIKQMYAGHAPQVMALAAQCTAGAYFGKYVIVVDDDIDPSNIGQVLWAMATRSRPAQSIDILRETWSTFLDPSQNPPEIRPWGSKALINACMDFRHIKNFSPRTKLDKNTYDRVVARWQELGLSGKPPEIVEKMVAGRVAKFLKEVTLVGQPFVKDPDQTVGKLLASAGATVTSFIRFEVGEGIEKKVENFADEVMKQIADAKKSG